MGSAAGTQRQSSADSVDSGRQFRGRSALVESASSSELVEAGVEVGSLEGKWALHDEDSEDELQPEQQHDEEQQQREAESIDKEMLDGSPRQPQAQHILLKIDASVSTLVREKFSATSDSLRRSDKEDNEEEDDAIRLASRQKAQQVKESLQPPAELPMDVVTQEVAEPGGLAESGGRRRCSRSLGSLARRITDSDVARMPTPLRAMHEFRPPPRQVSNFVWWRVATVSREHAAEDCQWCWRADVVREAKVLADMKGLVLPILDVASANRIAERNPAEARRFRHHFDAASTDGRRQLWSPSFMDVLDALQWGLGDQLVRVSISTLQQMAKKNGVHARWSFPEPEVPSSWHSPAPHAARRAEMPPPILPVPHAAMHPRFGDGQPEVPPVPTRLPGTLFQQRQAWCHLPGNEEVAHKLERVAAGEMKRRMLFDDEEEQEEKQEEKEMRKEYSESIAHVVEVEQATSLTMNSGEAESAATDVATADDGWARKEEVTRRLITQWRKPSKDTVVCQGG
eukprot:gnl/TRDRNA2_/TRDRNA2_59106_c0_seq2.p1 gnl/TRDRNA2_/TRDRNA2_59106_c0~~gnl/TRDRNA2_/TRDRNA2_59106_c0_seq2.p1  ORF type:complete len:513 (-),score=93.16 gnl/TRDRNA2_/TRDRNA2_59106_c0_seq2:64-1602(-)